MSFSGCCVAAITRTSTGMCGRSAEPRDLALLQHAQQERLQLQRYAADLVEEEGARVRRLEEAALAAAA